MKCIYFFVLLMFLLIACDKPVESYEQLTDLTIVQTTTPKTATVNQNIVATVKVSGPDLCYRFAYFTVNQQQLLVDIRAIGTYPTKPGACPLAIYYKDTTLSIPATKPGNYVLRFYNNAQLFKSDTVQVN
jgi:hypothetical protein